MQKKQVAVIDVGSSQITAVIGERGINKTFVIKGRFSYEYDGFADGEFFDKDKLNKILLDLSEKIVEVSHGKINTVYLGVPGEFTSVIVKDSQISFPKKKKITEEDLDTLFDAGFVLSSKKHTLINRSAIVYELDDFRRLANPVGAQSVTLKGKLSFVVCDNKFLETVIPPIKAGGIQYVECVSSPLCEALYLVEPETRDRIAIIVDIGYIATTFTIVQGDGIIYQKSFGYGGGYVTAEISSKFDIDFPIAEKLKRKVNLSSLSMGGSYSLIDCENEYYNAEEVKSAVISSLDGLSETLTDIIEGLPFVVPDYVPLFVTGGGIAYIRGAKEHVSNRLGMMVEIISPKVPMMDSPTESSVLSLLDLALEQN
jgi:cell division protein FtsA